MAICCDGSAQIPPNALRGNYSLTGKKNWMRIYIQTSQILSLIAIFLKFVEQALKNCPLGVQKKTESM